MVNRLWALFILSLTFASCGGPSFMDKTKIDGSVLRGDIVLSNDDIYGRTVFLAKNFSLDNSLPSLFHKFGLCSGVIIHERYVLTAAHCTQNIQNTRVIFSNDVNKALSFDQIYTIEEVKISEQYERERERELIHDIPSGLNNRSNLSDLAILKLSRPITGAQYDKNYFKKEVSFIAARDQNKEDSLEIKATVAGYGRITEYLSLDKDPNYQVPQEEVPPINGLLMKATLNFKFVDLASRLIKHSQRLSAGVCGGDSGAPVFITRENEFYLQAIAIATYKVKDEDPENRFNNCYGESLFLNLDFHKEWIYKTMLQLEEKKPTLLKKATY